MFIAHGGEGLVNGLKPQLWVLWTAEVAWKGGLEGRLSPYPIFRWVPPPLGLLQNSGRLSVHRWYKKISGGTCKYAGTSNYS